METDDLALHLKRFHPSWFWIVGVAVFNWVTLSVLRYRPDLILFIGGLDPPSGNNPSEEYDDGLIILTLAMLSLELLIFCQPMRKASSTSLIRDLPLIPGGNGLRLRLVAGNRAWVALFIAAFALLFPCSELTAERGEGLTPWILMGGTLPIMMEALGIMLICHAGLLRHRRFWAIAAPLWPVTAYALQIPFIVHVLAVMASGPIPYFIIYGLIVYTASRLGEVPWVSADAVQG